MKALWAETKRLPVVTKLRAELQQLQLKHAEASTVEQPALEEAIKKKEAVIAKRVADPDMLVNVKHVGTPEDPGAWDALQTRQQAERHAVEVRIRKGLLADHGSPQGVVQATGADKFEEALHQAFWLDAEWKGLLQKHSAEICAAGLVGGLDEAKKLVGMVGPVALMQAAVEVRAYQEVDVEMGEG